MAVGVDLAEVYVLRKMHKEKMKESEENGRPKKGTIGSKANKSSGCFFWFSMKLRRTTQIRNNNENG